jgi:LAO/AO transport system kinase
VTAPKHDGTTAGRQTEPMVDEPLDALAQGVLDGDRRSLARAITLAESTRPDHRADAEALLATLLPHTGGAVRIGISGAPGAGKSTFIEALGMHVVEREHRVAVLAVDPSSTRSGGSILGDKTRMEQLTRSPDAFVRPSPTSGTLGGVARRTREVLLLCEAAGFDVVLVETVGVGQSEVAVAAMVDLFLVLVSPGAGDELQGIKRGIMELADLVVVNKADGDLAPAAHATAADYANALHLVRPRTPSWSPRVLTSSALTGTGIAEVWGAVGDYRRAVAAELVAQRADQARAWMWSEVTDALVDSLRADPDVAALATRLETEVAQGLATPTAAALQLLGRYLHST